jgi:hypothetical protein
VRAINKVALSHNAAACPKLPTVRTFQPSATVNDPTVGTLQPVQHQSATRSFSGSANPVYLVSTVRAPSSTYRLWRLRNLTSSAPKLDHVNVTAATGYSQPNDAPQHGGAPDLDTGTARVISAVGQGNTVTLAHTTGCNVGGGAVETCIRLLRITAGQNPAGLPTATASRLLTIDGAPGEFLYHPGVSVNASGHAAVLFLRSSTTRFLGSAWTLQGPTTSPEPVMGLSDGTCHRSSERTGDFTGAALSPNGASFWVGAERAATLGATCIWQTSVAEITP